MQTAIAEAKDLLERLPAQASFEDIQYHLYVIAKVQQSLARVDDEGGVPHEEAEQRFAKWLAD